MKKKNPGATGGPPAVAKQSIRPKKITGFQLFMEDQRSMHDPSADTASDTDDFTLQTTQQWRKMSKEEKQAWNDQAKVQQAAASGVSTTSQKQLTMKPVAKKITADEGDKENNAGLDKPDQIVSS